MTSATEFPALPHRVNRRDPCRPNIGSVLVGRCKGDKYERHPGGGAPPDPVPRLSCCRVSCSMTSASPRNRIPIPRTPDGALTAAVSWVSCGSQMGREVGGRRRHWGIVRGTLIVVLRRNLHQGPLMRRWKRRYTYHPLWTGQQHPLRLDGDGPFTLNSNP